MPHKRPFPLERFDACVEFQDLYEDCGCFTIELEHGESAGEGHKCHFVQPVYTILKGKCSKCSKHPHSIRRESIAKASKAVGLKTLTKWAERSIQIHAAKDEDARQFRLAKWKAEIEKYEAFKKEFREEQKRLAEFQARLRGVRIAEETTVNLHPHDRAIVYDPKDQYSELLSKIYCLESASCCWCDGRGTGELKRFPCRHAIHDGSCFKMWLSGAPPEDLDCPACQRRLKLLQVPLCPLTDGHNYKDIDEAVRKEVLRPSGMDKFRGGEMANVPPSTSLGTRAILGRRQT